MVGFFRGGSGERRGAGSLMERDSFDRLRAATARVVGTKQTTRAVQNGQATVVFVARDAEERVTGPLVRLCRDRRVELVWVEQMHELGRACGVEVGAAAAAILSERQGDGRSG